MQYVEKHRPRPQKHGKCSLYVSYTKSMYSAFQYDAEAFLRKFEKNQTLNYADFATLWQTTNFTFVFADQNYVRPLKILCEMCFLILKKYIMFQSNVYIQAGAFYLLYGLYYKQPIQRLVKIRLTLEEYKKIKTLMNEMDNKGQYDILYIFAKMKTDGAFLFVAHLKELSILRRPNTYMDGNDTFSENDYESSLHKFSNLLKDETVLALEQTCNEYETKLKTFAEMNPSFVPFQSTIIEDLKAAHHVIDTNESTVVKQEALIELPEENVRRDIRQKAMKNQKAQYRGSRKVITALDLIDDSESE